MRFHNLWKRHTVFLIDLLTHAGIAECQKLRLNLFGRHLDYFITTFGFAPKTIAFNIQEAYDHETLPPYSSPSDDNSTRMDLIADLIYSIPARRKLLEMQRGYVVSTENDPDELIYAGFSKETAKSFIENFEK